MNVLALEPYFGGSHRAFLEGWMENSRHAWTLLNLPPYKWKWRMHHAAVTFSEQVRARHLNGEQWDLVFATDMLDLSTFKGLTPEVAQRPSVVYFHENQLTYPMEDDAERNYTYGFMHLTTGLAATKVWFNSAFHRDEFLAALDAWMRRMTDYPLRDAAPAIRDKSLVHPPGIRPFPPRGAREPGPIRILWAARWEYDKDPETLFHALAILKKKGIPFRLSVLGRQSTEVPAVFDRAHASFGDHIDHWGYAEPEAYRAALLQADVAVSTAQHEFFGIGMVEAAAAGAFPVAPARLAYPEVLNRPEAPDFFYDGGAEALADKLRAGARAVEDGSLWGGDPDQGRILVRKFTWPELTPFLDEGLDEAANAIIC